MADDPLSITFAALADPTRRAILARLADGEATVNELAEPFDMSLQAVSKHLKVLERAGLISRGRNAQYRPCRLEAAPLDAPSTGSSATARSGTDRFDRLEQHLRDIQQPERQAPDDQHPSQKETTDERHQHEPRRSHLHPHLRRPAELVFRCMIEPEHLTHFWGPVGVTTPLENITVDPRPGGVFETTMVERRERRGVPDAAPSSSRSSSPSASSAPSPTSRAG